jgi:hypothetical protein
MNSSFIPHSPCRLGSTQMTPWMLLASQLCDSWCRTLVRISPNYRDTEPVGEWGCGRAHLSLAGPSLYTSTAFQKLLPSEQSNTSSHSPAARSARSLWVQGSREPGLSQPCAVHICVCNMSTIGPVWAVCCAGPVDLPDLSTNKYFHGSCVGVTISYLLEVPQTMGLKPCYPASPACLLPQMGGGRLHKNLPLKGRAWPGPHLQCTPLCPACSSPSWEALGPGGTRGWRASPSQPFPARPATSPVSLLLMSSSAHLAPLCLSSDIVVRWCGGHHDPMASQQLWGGWERRFRPAPPHPMPLSPSPWRTLHTKGPDVRPRQDREGWPEHQVLCTCSLLVPPQAVPTSGALVQRSILA